MEHYICLIFVAILWLALLGGVLLPRLLTPVTQDCFTVSPDSFGLPDWEYRFCLCHGFGKKIRVQCVSWPCSFGSVQMGLTRWRGRVVLNQAFHSQAEAEAAAAAWAEENQRRLAGGITVYESLRYI
jgi:hypothetical protein